MKRTLLIFALLGLTVLSFGQSGIGAPSDVPRNHWAFKDVDAMFKLGLLDGYPDGLFHGSRPASRFEMAVLMDATYGELKKELRTLQTRISNLPAGSNASATKALESKTVVLKNEIRSLKPLGQELLALGAKQQALRSNLNDLKHEVRSMHAEIGALGHR